jgi:hypothetical protein
MRQVMKKFWSEHWPLTFAAVGTLLVVAAFVLGAASKFIGLAIDDRVFFGLGIAGLVAMLLTLPMAALQNPSARW